MLMCKSYTCLGDLTKNPARNVDKANNKTFQFNFGSLFHFNWLFYTVILHIW